MSEKLCKCSRFLAQLLRSPITSTHYIASFIMIVRTNGDDNHDYVALDDECEANDGDEANIHGDGNNVDDDCHDDNDGKGKPPHKRVFFLVIRF